MLVEYNLGVRIPILLRISPVNRTWNFAFPRDYSTREVEVSIVTLKSAKRGREREKGILQSERWRIIIWIEVHGRRGKFNMQIAGHYASFIPVFRSWRGPDGNSSSRETNSLPLEKADESWWMKRGSGRDSWTKGKTRKAREEESPNVVLHTCFITPGGGERE